MAMGRSAQNQRPYPLARLSPPALQTTFSAKKLEAPRGGAVTAAADRGVHLALAGAIATMIGDFAMHPIDCIKTLQQSNSGAGLSMLGASKTIWKTSGLGGFYAGMGTYIFCDGVAGSIKFATYEALKKYTKKNVKEEYYGAALFGCAAAAFIASSFVLVPGELIKQRLQNGDYTSLANGISTIFKNEGCGGFYTGYAAVCFRDVPYTMLELGLYDNLKSAYLFFKNRSNKKGGKSYEITQADEIVCAALTGGITGYVTNPLDSIKTKIVLDGSMYSGFMDCFRQSVAAGGVGSLFNGGAARVSWLMPFTAIYLPIYETLKRSFASSRTDKAKGWRLASGGGRGGGGMGVGGVLGEGGQKREGVCFVNTSEANANAKC